MDTMKREMRYFPFIKFHSKSNFTITKLQWQSFLLIILFPKVEKVLERRVRPTLGLAQKEAWEYLIKWKGLKFVYSTTSFVTLFPTFRSR